MTNITQLLSLHSFRTRRTRSWSPTCGWDWWVASDWFCFLCLLSALLLRLVFPWCTAVEVSLYLCIKESSYSHDAKFLIRFPFPCGSELSHESTEFSRRVSFTCGVQFLAITPLSFIMAVYFLINLINFLVALKFPRSTQYFVTVFDFLVCMNLSNIPQFPYHTHLPPQSPTFSFLQYFHYFKKLNSADASISLTTISAYYLRINVRMRPRY